MNRFFLDINIFIICLLFLSSCNDKQDEQMQSSLDSLKSAIDTVSHYDTLASGSAFDSVLLEYSKKYNAVTDFSSFKNSNTSGSAAILKSKYLLFPLFKNQIDYLTQDASTDTVLVYFNDNSVAFVLDADSGLDKIKKLDKQKNGLILFKAKKVETSQKMYLIKRSRDFQHKERKVTEFYLNGEIIDAFNVNTPEKLLLEKFKFIQ